MTVAQNVCLRSVMYLECTFASGTLSAEGLLIL